MGGVLLKKKKVIIQKKRYVEPRVWRSAWSSRWRRFLRKKIRGSRARIEILKKKSKVSPHKKYKLFKKKINFDDSIRKHGDGRLIKGGIGFRCLKACKLNFSTMLGIKKKTEILRKNVKVSFRKYPNLLLTRKSTGHRMGKGKGKFSARIAKYKKGEILFEVSYFDLGVFDNIFKAISKTFPVPVEIVERSPLILKAWKDAFDGVKNFKRPRKRKSKYRKSIRN